MEYVDLPRYFSSLGLVIALILGLALLAKRFNIAGLSAHAVRKNARLQIVERVFVDAKHRVVIIRSDKREHVVLLGVNYCQLLESKTITPSEFASHEAGVPDNVPSS